MARAYCVFPRKRPQFERSCLKANNQGTVVTNPSALLNRLAHVFDDLFGIAKHHHGFVHVKEFIE